MEHGLTDTDAVFDLLANRRRRRTVTVLRSDDRRLTITDLSRKLAVEEAGPLITDVPGETVREIFVSLRHVHVPKLADLELVEYDRNRGLVEPTDRLAGLEPYLSIVSESDPEPRSERDDS
ncbi:hypothetical protein QA600_07195 [Natronococcus sp. A-GB1]|uniref:DUF7344 domain-containing protein n=1 Tax=Natronococcus sp. A-GB1 TaxID=3037648 RepID=UPI00241C312C|nr:hypothetical protein [Natronococcus sp. A-GB1]MDG5759124.1 hypothetical protein [Natronococcus sp. A-GB1]